MSTDVPPDLSKPAPPERESLERPKSVESGDPIGIAAFVDHEIPDSEGNMIKVHTPGIIIIGAAPATKKKVEAPA